MPTETKWVGGQTSGLPVRHATTRSDDAQGDRKIKYRSIVPDSVPSQLGQTVRNKLIG